MSDKTCAECKYGCPLGEGDLLCDRDYTVKRNYLWVICEHYE